MLTQPTSWGLVVAAAAVFYLLAEIGLRAGHESYALRFTPQALAADLGVNAVFITLVSASLLVPLYGLLFVAQNSHRILELGHSPATVMLVAILLSMAYTATILALGYHSEKARQRTSH